LTLAYFLSGRLGLLAPYVGENITLIWPPTGIAVAVLFRGGSRYWPGIWLGALLVNLSIGSPWNVAMAIAAGNTAGPLLAAWLLRRGGFRPAFERRVDVLRFVFIGALACMALNATVGVLTLATGGLVPVEQMPSAWLVWWLGDAAGVLVVAPVALSLVMKDWRLLVIGHGAAEYLLLSGAMIATTVLVFVPLTTHLGLSLSLLPFPLLIAIAMRHGVQRASLAVLLLAVIAILGTALGRGPFFTDSLHQSLMLIWSYVTIVTVIALLITGLQTEMRYAQFQLRAEQQRLAHIIEGTQAGTWEWNIQTGETRFNEQWARIIGYTLQELGTTTIATWASHAHPDDLARSSELVRRHLDGETEAYESEARMRHKDGHWVWVLDRGRVQTWTPDGKPEWMFGTHIECTERKQQELALRESQSLLNRTGEVAGIGGWVVDLASGQIAWSDQTCRIHGVPPGHRPTLEEAIGFFAVEAQPVIREAVERGIAMGSGWDLELPLIQLDGRRIWVRATGAVEFEGGRSVRLIGAIQDITARRRAEEQLAQSQRLEALGQLTGGLAHDYNNILGIILGALDMLADLPQTDEARELIATAQSAAQRGAEVAKPLLALSRREALAPSTVDLHGLLRELTPLLVQTAGKRVEVVVAMQSQAPVVLIESGAFNNSLLNIVINARDAMPEGGRLTIATGDLRVEHRDDRGLQTGDYVVISLSDTGVGMSADVAARAFDPFFTTKRRGKGTGLGLSMVYGFAQRSKGKAILESVEGHGTTVSLLLPRARTTVGIATTTGGVASDGTSAPGKGRVLVVDDEFDFQQLVARRLQSLGYRTVTASSGAEALDALRREPFDLLLSDVVMPGAVDGVELAVQARTIQPAIRIVMMSGFADADLRRIPGEWQLLDKPIDGETLANAVRSAVSQTAPARDGAVATS
jgi:PAS domain S-box-containing protein